MSHIRRILRTDADAMRAANPGVSDYRIAAALGGVLVGQSTTYYYFHVAGEDDPALPGEFVSADYAGLSAQVADVILENVWQNADGTTERGKRRDMPAEATPLQTDLVPHVFAT